MVIYTRKLHTSDGTQDPVYNEFKMAYVYCEDDETKYCLSLSRCLPDELVQVMVLDQKCCNTREIAVELSQEQLRLSLSPAVAADLDGIAEYLVPLSVTNEQLGNLDAALVTIFQGGHRGKYDRLFG